MTEKSNAYSQVMAICGVPPEQVPEGILNFARSNRKQIFHVKVLIMNNDQDNEELPDGRLPSNPNPNPNTPDRSLHGDIIGSRRERSPTSSFTFMEDAAANSGTESSRDSSSTNTLYMVLLSPLHR
jgi:hypothetical protein